MFKLREFPINVMAIKERRVCVIASLDDPALSPERRASLEKWGYQSQLCAPLVVRDAVIGILELSDHVPRDFGEHLELIEGLAHVAGRALDNAVLFEEIRRRNVILHELVEFGALVTGADDLVTLLRAAAKRLVEVLDAADCDVFTLEGDHLLSRVSYDRDGYDETAVGHTLRLDDFAGVTAAIQSQEIRTVASPDDPGLDPDERLIFEEWGFQSCLSLPLVVDGVVKGLVDIYDDRPNDFAEYVDFLQTVGQLLAGALDKARLLDSVEDSNRDLRELVDSGLEFGSSLELDEVLGSVAARLRGVADADECQILGLEETDLVVRICVGRTGSRDEVVGRRCPLGEQRAAERATRTRQPVAVRDADGDDDLAPQERALLAAAHHRASIHLPLVVRGEVVGLVALFDGEPREFVCDCRCCRDSPRSPPRRWPTPPSTAPSTRAAGASRSSRTPASSSPRASSCPTSCARPPIVSARSAWRPLATSISWPDPTSSAWPASSWGRSCPSGSDGRIPWPAGRR